VIRRRRLETAVKIHQIHRCETSLNKDWGPSINAFRTTVQHRPYVRTRSSQALHQAFHLLPHNHTMSQQSKNFAAVLHQVASPLVAEELPKPKPGPTEVLIRNHAIAVNPVDWKRQAWGFAISSYPVVMGSGKNSRLHRSIIRKSSFLHQL
jgi:hypothetical protein